MARFALFIAASIGFVLAVVLGNLLVPFTGKFGPPDLRAEPAGDPLKVTPRKTRTHAMPGAVSFVLAALAALGFAWLGLRILEPGLSGGPQLSELILSLVCAGGFGGIGLAFDLLCIKTKLPMAFSQRRILALEGAVAAAYLLALHLMGVLDTGAVLPGMGYVQLGMLAYPLYWLLLVAVVESAARTDGPDGLCTGVSFVLMLGGVALAVLLNCFELALLPSAVLGALMGFSLWNMYPARLSMGRGGSMFLGGALCGLAFGLGWPGLLLLLALPYLAEGASVAVQVVYAKLTRGKSLMKSAPIHRILELSGWSAVQIDYAFALLALTGAALSFLFVRLN